MPRISTVSTIPKTSGPTCHRPHRHPLRVFNVNHDALSCSFTLVRVVQTLEEQGPGF